MKLKIAAIQMDANPAPTPERLARAGQLVEQAAQAGAQLVVLPELFNTGYTYSDENFQRAESLDGPTPCWMKERSARLQIHLAGSLMVHDQGEIYNALLLFAPDGRLWRYDKRYPWGWERSYFRPGRQASIAQTDLGDIGLMICWDVAHPGLWRGYAGLVDLILICSCPPDVANPTLHFPDGKEAGAERLGPAMARLKGSAQKVFGETIDQQTAWLGVPAVNTVGCGRIRTTLPQSKASILVFSTGAPWLVSYLPQAEQAVMSFHFVQGCKIIDQEGQVIGELTQKEGETLVLAEVNLADRKTGPRHAQPKPPVPWLAYFLSDHVLNRLSVPVYRNGLRKMQNLEIDKDQIVE